MAAHLVRTMAKYAAGSGISEIKCILAGFIMKGFLGFGTFFIKSLTLVRSSTRVFGWVLIRYSPWSLPLACLLEKKDRLYTLRAALGPWLPDGHGASLEVQVRDNSFCPHYSCSCLLQAKRERSSRLHPRPVLPSLLVRQSVVCCFQSR